MEPPPARCPWAQAGRRPKALQGPTRPCPQTGWSRSDRVLRTARPRPSHAGQDGPGPAVSAGMAQARPCPQTVGLRRRPAHLPCGEPAGTCCMSPVHTVAGRSADDPCHSAGVFIQRGPALMGTLSLSSGQRPQELQGPTFTTWSHRGCPGPSLGPQDKIGWAHQRLARWTGLLLPDPRAAELGSAAGPGREGAGMGAHSPLGHWWGAAPA